ncbi:MAG: hypothetical protein HUJ92_08165 [Bacteroidales bacterium]|nr:hypothetical protein [Bacteroidales bacterium]
MVSTFFPLGYELEEPFHPNAHTLYWNPNIITDAEGKAIIDFNNKNSSYVVRIEGVTGTGDFVSAMKVVDLLSPVEKSH